jgi:transcriptional regulator with XRE-family HTH domain
MIKIENAPTVLERALAEWRKQETLKRGRTSIRKFADYLGYSQALVGFWLNKKQKISEGALINIAPKLATLLGNEIYKELEITKPNIYKEYAIRNWEKLPEKKQKEITKIIKKYTNEPTPNEKEP